MQNRHFLLGILFVGLLWQIPIAAQSADTLTRTSGIAVTPRAGLSVSPFMIHVTQTASNTFDFEAIATSPGASITSYAWDFGDGTTASGSQASHRYTVVGLHVVRLTTVDSKQVTGSASTTVVSVSATMTRPVNVSLGSLLRGTASPSASIFVKPKSSDTFDFSAGLSRSRPIVVTSYTWNFGDGNTAAGPAVSHRYMSSGTYTVALTEVDASGGSKVATQSVSASVAGGSPPTASIIATATASDTFTFSSTASASNGATIASYNWNFGDGITATGSTASHTYLASGTYAVILTVLDNKGVSGTATKSVAATVAAPPPSVTISAVQTALDAYDF